MDHMFWQSSRFTTECGVIMKTYEKVTINAGDVSWDIIRMTDESGQIWSVPIDEANSDYKAYLIWLEEQNG